MKVKYYVNREIEKEKAQLKQINSEFNDFMENINKVTSDDKLAKPKRLDLSHLNL